MTTQTPEGRPLRGSEHEAFARALEASLSAIEELGIDYLLIGGLGVAAYGHNRWTHDIDYMVRPNDAAAALRALEKRGFTVEETEPSWLYKGFLDDVMVDLIFRSSGDVVLDPTMVRHARRERIGSVAGNVISPEDLVVVKAAATAEVVPNHWYDALAIIAFNDLDWDYLLERAKRHAVRRVLSLLLFAQSNDLGVPLSVVRALSAEVIG